MTYLYQIVIVLQAPLALDVLPQRGVCRPLLLSKDETVLHRRQDV